MTTRLLDRGRIGETDRFAVVAGVDLVPAFSGEEVGGGAKGRPDHVADVAHDAGLEPSAEEPDPVSAGESDVLPLKAMGRGSAMEKSACRTQQKQMSLYRMLAARPEFAATVRRLSARSRQRSDRNASGMDPVPGCCVERRRHPRRRVHAPQFLKLGRTESGLDRDDCLGGHVVPAEIPESGDRRERCPSPHRQTAAGGSSRCRPS